MGSKIRADNRAPAQQERRASGGGGKGLFAELERIVGPAGVVRHAGALAAYESDGFLAKGRPTAVCLPRTTEEVAGLIRFAARHALPVIPRGAGTGLSGGAILSEGGIAIGFSRMRRILE
ncbi:MAG TPA: FAD-binding protein, partial [Chloroflexota bacterium]|nr:FAD-binding protein [Chloroflexota bacterium]